MLIFIHYGHSCLVPITTTKMNMLYVFVDIKIDINHMINCLIDNFDKNDRILLSGTIQFASSLQASYKLLKEYFNNIYIPKQNIITW